MINNYKDLTLEKYIELYEMDIQGLTELEIQFAELFRLKSQWELSVHMKLNFQCTLNLIR